MPNQLCVFACVYGGRGFVLHHTSELNIPKCNFLNVKRAGLAAHHSVGYSFSVKQKHLESSQVGCFLFFPIILF